MPRLALVGPQTGNRGPSDWYPPYTSILGLVDTTSWTVAGGELGIDSFDDKGEMSDVRGVAKRICADSGIVAVIGYVWSDAAKVAISQYAKCASPVPTILVAATNDSLTLQVATATKKRGPFLQMPLANNYQARQIVLALGDTYPATDTVKAVLLHPGPDANETYAEPLARKIRELSVSYKKAVFQWHDESYTLGFAWRAFQAEQNLTRRDLVIFIGNTSSAPNLFNGRDPANSPVVIVTDGMVNETLLVDNARCVWGSFPAVADTSSRAPTFASFGVAALAVVERWVDQQDSTKMPLTRHEFARFVDTLTDAGKAINSDDGTTIGFGRTGRRIVVPNDASSDWPSYYHIMQVRRSDVGLRWTHRARRTSLTECQ